MENKKIKNIITLILVLLVLGLGGYLIYEKVFNNKAEQYKIEADDLKKQVETLKSNNEQYKMETDDLKKQVEALKSNNDQLKTTEKTTVKTMFKELVGTYSQKKTFKYDFVDQCIQKATLTLKNDGTYNYESSCDCGGGNSASGKFTLGIDKIYLYNDTCKPIVDGKKCINPNCKQVLEIEYKNGILATTETCFGERLELIKQ